MPSATVRINADTHAKLKKLACETGESMPSVLARAIESFRRQRFLEELGEDFERLRSDPKEWQAELAERAEWDATSTADLDNGFRLTTEQTSLHCTHRITPWTMTN